MKMMEVFILKFQTIAQYQIPEILSRWCVRVYVCVRACVRMYMCVRVHVCLCDCVFVCMHVHAM